MARAVANTVRLWEVISCKTSHFGRNPVSGGRPPKDINKIRVKEAIVGDTVHDVVRSLIVFDESSSNIVNVESVIIRYSTRFKIMIFGEMVRIVAIHPRWAIDE